MFRQTSGITAFRLHGMGFSAPNLPSLLQEIETIVD